MNPDMIVDNLLLGNDLSRFEARHFFRYLLNGQCASETGMQGLVLLQKKGEDETELFTLITAARKRGRALQKLKGVVIADLCGTGGDHKGLFNVSSIAGFVVAGVGGIHVAKHGNRSVTSRCGSSDLMRALGVRLDAKPSQMLRALRQGGIGYFHAPVYSKAFRRVQEIRRAIAAQKIRTIFNVSGPLLNPLRPPYQLVGVYSKRVMPLVAKTLQRLGIRRALIVCGQDGTDEMIPCQLTHVAELREGTIRYSVLRPSIQLRRGESARQLRGGTIRRNLWIAIRLLANKDHSIRRDTVVLNAAALLYVSGRTPSISAGIRLADHSISSGSALKSLRELVRCSHGA